MHFVRAGVVCLCLLASSARAQGTARGLAPDAQLTGGIGAALNGKLDNLFLGRLRLGVLYAFDPFWVGAGAIAEVGALPGLSLGGELEFNQIQGWFGNVGLAYAEHQRITGHLTLGYMVFGVEWQHDFTRSKPNDALLASVRLPLGFWWFASRSEKKSAAPPPSAATPAKIGPRTRPPAAPAARVPARSPAQPDLDAAVIAQTQGD
ncbi:MAG TPA: hypothetical protein VJV78_15545, partial [Polyangiales bacterium]|nr:hypothetical protein [Polyangiales bacterium]